MIVDFLKNGQVDERELKYAVIAAYFNGKWIYVRHKLRNTWEIPGGHREEGEAINDTAKRELYEETGASTFNIEMVCDYLVTTSSEKSYGRLFFAEITELGDLPDMEIGEIRMYDTLPEELTYPQIQPLLYKRVLSMVELDLTIEQITEANFHMFDDMVFWRLNERERAPSEKEQSLKMEFTKACMELKHEDFRLYGALYEGRFIGWISLIYMPKLGRWNRGVIYIDELWTAPEFRKRGVATKLMEKAYEFQANTGAVKIRLYTSNLPAQELYKKCGFKIISPAVFMETDEV